MTQRPDPTRGLDSPEPLDAASGADPESLDALLVDLDSRAEPRADDGPRPFATTPPPDPEIRLFDDLRSRFAEVRGNEPLLDDPRFPDSATVLRFPNETPDEIWRRLARDGEMLDIAPHAEPRLVGPGQRGEALRAALDQHRPAPRLEAAPPPELFRARSRAASARRVQTALTAPVLRSRLETIADEAALCEQETGRAVLFLVFGVLEWRRPEAPEVPCLAPLLLLPVHLERRNEHGRLVHALSATAETAARNPALVETFPDSFDRTLPEFPANAGSPTPVAEWFDAVDGAVADLDGFAVRRFLTLAVMRPGRRALFRDLDPRRYAETPATHPLVGPVLRALSAPRHAAPPPAVPIDDAASEAAAPLLVHPADSVEHAALADAATGGNPVIHAPPGTAVSRTVANIVADAMARGRTVLVLSEKQAALEGVKARLDEAGLSVFCLEAHGRRGSPRGIIQQLRERMGPQIPRAAPPRPDLAAREAAAKDLAAYAEALHAVQEDGETAFSLIWRFVAATAQHGSATRGFRGVDIPPVFFHRPDETARAGRDLARHLEAVVAYERAFGSPRATPWARLDPASLSPEAATVILDHLDEAHRAALELADLIRQTADFGLAGLDDLRRTMAALLPEAQDLSAVAEVSELDLDQLDSAVALRRQILACEEDLAPAPTLMDLEDGVLAQAAEMVAAARACAFAEVPPADAFSRAENEMRDAQQLVAAMNGLSGTLTLLGYDEDAESRLLAGVAAAVTIASSIPPVLRPWLAWEPGLPDRYDAVAARGKAIAEEEISWRQALPGYDSTTRPRPGELRAAADALRGAAVKRLFSSLSREGKIARALCERLGFQAPAEEWPDLLDSLAVHVESANAFDVDESAARAIGAVWAGVDTPFGVMAGAIRVRKAIREGLAGYFGGEEIAARMLGLDARGATEFGAFAPAAEIFRDIPGARTLGRESVRNSVRRYEEAIVRLTSFVGRDPDGAFSPVALPIDRIAALAERARERRRLVEELAASPVAGMLRDDRLDALTDAATWLRGIGGLSLPGPLKDQLVSAMAGETRRRLVTLGRRAEEPLQRLTGALQGLEEACGLSAIGADDPELVARQASEFLRGGDALPDFLRLTSGRVALEQEGLGPFLMRAEEARIRPEEIGPIFAHLVLRRRIEALRREYPALARSGAALEARRRAYGDQDRARMEKDRAGLRVQMYARAHDTEAARSGIRALERELRRERGVPGLRRLMREATAGMQVLKPCVLASPLTLAENFPRSVSFDLVVIVEASQIPVSLALGGLLRGRTLVVAGDPAGLPARDFLADDETGERGGADEMSVLDACTAAFGPTRRLVRRDDPGCESLPAFSDRMVYDGGLALIPGPRPENFAIDLVRCDGEAGGGRNETEAVRVTEEAIDFMRRFGGEEENEVPSLGIVTATAAQAALIRETMRRLENGDDRVMRYRESVGRRGEPFFVKSLDTVQGERRDCILASLVYDRAAAAGAAASRRFGGFSGRHGVRLVNVLATRARMRMAVMASFGSDDVSLAEAAPAGEGLLRAWLAYVEEKGRSVELRAARTREAGLPAAFENEIAGRLRTRGYEVASGIGVSGRDPLLGVRHGGRPGSWLAGIETDGATHRPSTNPRDRDRLRDEALRAMGWDVLRVWSTDWFDDPDLQTSRLMIQLEGLRRKEPEAERIYFRFAAPEEAPAEDGDEAEPDEARGTGGTAA